MSSIRDVLAQHHQHCDELFSTCEEACLDKRWDAGGPAFAQFRAAFAGHLAAEESLLFPAFEAAMGSSAGPTQVMKIEHEQMRGLLAAMERALAAQDRNDFAGQADTLLILMQQHNLKEENILYPMCDNVLAADAGDLAARLGAACPS
ncbi:MAG: hemerythrin domain-containing protein [Rhodocyclales bacterium]|nr:hemerythrin domain-containing protein [Rhodocyclales bacterium]